MTKLKINHGYLTTCKLFIDQILHEWILHQIVFEKKFKKSCNLIGGEHFGLYNLRIRFFPDM